MMLDMCVIVLCFNKLYLGVAAAPSGGRCKRGGLLTLKNFFAELGSCEHLFLYVMGAVGTSNDGQSVPAATSTHPKKLWHTSIDPL